MDLFQVLPCCFLGWMVTYCDIPSTPNFLCSTGIHGCYYKNQANKKKKKICSKKHFGFVGEVSRLKWVNRGNLPAELSCENAWACTCIFTGTVVIFTKYFTILTCERLSTVETINDFSCLSCTKKKSFVRCHTVLLLSWFCKYRETTSYVHKKKSLSHLSLYSDSPPPHLISDKQWGFGSPLSSMGLCHQA